MHLQHSDKQDLLCPYCDYKFLNPPHPDDLFGDQMTEEWEYTCDCNRGDFKPVRIKCENEKCGRMFDVTYRHDYKWWSSKAVDCKPQAHIWGNKLTSFSSKYSDDGICRYYECTKCSCNLYIRHFNLDGSVPTSKEYKKLESKKKREKWLQDHPEELELLEVKDVTVYINEYSGASFHVDIDDKRGNKELWLGALNVMKDIGFNIGQLPQYQKGGHFSSLANGQRHCTWKGLECEAELMGIGMKFEFYQNVVLEDGEEPGRGKYSYKKLEIMPYLMEKKMEYTFLKLREYFEKHSNINLIDYVPKHLRNGGHGIGRDWHGYPDTGKLKGAEAVNHIRQHCVSKGKPDYVEKYSGPMGINGGRDVSDQNGKVTQDGEMKYAYIKNRLHRGQIYYRCGSYSFFVLNDNSYTLQEVYKTFNKKEDMPRRFVSLEDRHKKLEKALSKKVKEKNFIRCSRIQKQLDLLEIQ